MTRGRGEVAVGPLREAFLRSGRSSVDVARALGWMARQGRRPDDNRLRRTLGLKSYSPGKGYPSRRRERVDYAVAVQVAEAIGVDPVSVGL